MIDLSKKFDEAMFDIYRRAKSEAGYTATVFLGMLNDRGGLSVAKYLINAAKPSDGYTALYLRGRLDLTVEAMVVEHLQWHELFTPEELAKARKRLEDYRYPNLDHCVNFKNLRVRTTWVPFPRIARVTRDVRRG